MKNPLLTQQTELEKHMSVLRFQFLGSLKQREEELEEAICNIAAYGADFEQISKLYYVAHKLVGVAPTYAFHELAKAAERVETMLEACMTMPNTTLKIEPVLMASDALAEEVRNALASIEAR